MNTAKQWRHEDMMVIAHEENSYREMLGLCYSVHFSVPCPPSNDLLDHVVFYFCCQFYYYKKRCFLLSSPDLIIHFFFLIVFVCLHIYKESKTLDSKNMLFECKERAYVY